MLSSVAANAGLERRPYRISRCFRARLTDNNAGDCQRKPDNANSEVNMQFEQDPKLQPSAAVTFGVTIPRSDHDRRRREELRLSNSAGSSSVCSTSACASMRRMKFLL